MKIYLAGSFAFKDQQINKERQEFIAGIANILRSAKFDVYVPQELKIDAKDENGNWSMTHSEWANAVFEHDKHAIESSDALVCISFGKEGNSGGAARECGYAYGIHKPIVIYKADPEQIESIMMINSANSVVDDHEELLTFLEGFKTGYTSKINCIQD